MTRLNMSNDSNHNAHESSHISTDKHSPKKYYLRNVQRSASQAFSPDRPQSFIERHMQSTEQLRKKQSRQNFFKNYNIKAAYGIDSSATMMVQNEQPSSTFELGKDRQSLSQPDLGQKMIPQINRRQQPQNSNKAGQGGYKLMKITNYIDDDIQFTRGNGDDQQITPDAASNEDL